MTSTPNISIRAPHDSGFDEILTPEALNFLVRLHDHFAGPRHEHLRARQDARIRVENGRDLDFLSETAAIREDPSWRVAGPGPGLTDRRVEITGPTDPKMTVNALNSGANVWLADQEDATSPTWQNVIGGQVSLFRAIRGELDFTDPASGKHYAVGAETPTIVLRPRGWHLVEKHITVRDRAGNWAPAIGALVDFGLYLFHNARALIDAGRGPYFYLPKLENHREARLWDEIFTWSENALGLDHGTIRATVLIETISAAFEMDEILWELRDHCAGLNAGRWDYIFSIIKTYRGRGPRFLLPDRERVTMAAPFMKAYAELLVATCHRRGAYAIGGMSAFIPNRRDPEVTATAIARVREDKAREAAAGFDGTWVAHPDLVPIARAEFDAVLRGRTNQLDVLREDVSVRGADLLNLESVPVVVTDAGVRANVSVAVRYLAAWLGGTGAVALNNLMEDAATAEIARGQLWQWTHYGTVTAEGTAITAAWVRSLLDAEVAAAPGDSGRIAEAAELVADAALGDDFPTFLTIAAYAHHLVELEERTELAA